MMILIMCVSDDYEMEKLNMTMALERNSSTKQLILGIFTVRHVLLEVIFT